MKNEDTCPCKSGKTFGECCGPIISGEKKAESGAAGPQYPALGMGW